MTSLTCEISETKRMSKPNQTDTELDIENKQVVARGKLGGGRKKQTRDIKRYKGSRCKIYELQV